MHNKLKIKKGDRYGRLSIIQEIKGKKMKCGVTPRRFKCKCNCGKITIVFLGDLRSKKTESCGCLSLEASLRNLIKATVALRKKNDIKEKKININGYCKTKIHRTWKGIIQRCTYPNHKAYDRYGGRGIKCLWNSFQEFKNDMYESYLEHIKEFGEKQTTIDRIDNNGNYYKENCRWATQKEQTRNKRNNKFIIYNNEKLCFADWAEKLGGTKSLISHRINILKWNPIEAVTTPIGKIKNYV